MILSTLYQQAAKSKYILEKFLSKNANFLIDVRA